MAKIPKKLVSKVIKKAGKSIKKIPGKVIRGTKKVLISALPASMASFFSDKSGNQQVAEIKEQPQKLSRAEREFNNKKSQDEVKLSSLDRQGDILDYQEEVSQKELDRIKSESQELVDNAKKGIKESKSIKSRLDEFKEEFSSTFNDRVSTALVNNDRVIKANISGATTYKENLEGQLSDIKEQLNSLNEVLNDKESILGNSKNLEGERIIDSESLALVQKIESERQKLEEQQSKILLNLEDTKLRLQDYQTQSIENLSKLDSIRNKKNEVEDEKDQVETNTESKVDFKESKEGKSLMNQSKLANIAAALYCLPTLLSTFANYNAEKEAQEEAEEMGSEDIADAMELDPESIVKVEGGKVTEQGRLLNEQLQAKAESAAAHATSEEQYLSNAKEAERLKFWNEAQGGDLNKLSGIYDYFNNLVKSDAELKEKYHNAFDSDKTTTKKLLSSPELKSKLLAKGYNEELINDALLKLEGKDDNAIRESLAKIVDILNEESYESNAKSKMNSDKIEFNKAREEIQSGNKTIEDFTQEQLDKWNSMGLGNVEGNTLLSTQENSSDPIIVTSKFGYRDKTQSKIPNASNPHVGLDIRAKAGTEVYALDDGKVTEVKQSDKQLGAVRVVTSDKSSYRYVHVNPNSELRKGDYIRKGDLLGTIADGNRYVPHLHLESYSADKHELKGFGENNKFVPKEERLNVSNYTTLEDPVNLLKKHGFQLKPKDGLNGVERDDIGGEPYNEELLHQQLDQVKQLLLADIKINSQKAPSITNITSVSSGTQNFNQDHRK